MTSIIRNRFCNILHIFDNANLSAKLWSKVTTTKSCRWRHPKSVDGLMQLESKTNYSYVLRLILNLGDGTASINTARNERLNSLKTSLVHCSSTVDIRTGRHSWAYGLGCADMALRTRRSLTDADAGSNTGNKWAPPPKRSWSARLDWSSIERYVEAG